MCISMPVAVAKVSIASNSFITCFKSKTNDVLAGTSDPSKIEKPPTFRVTEISVVVVFATTTLVITAEVEDGTA